MSRSAVYYGAVLGLLYIVYGIIQLYNGVASWWLRREELMQLGVRALGTCIPNAFPDPFSGMALVTVGLLFLVSLYHCARGNAKHMGYLFAAWLLSMVMLALNVVEIIASILDAYYPLLYGGEPNYEWSLALDPWGMAPHLVLGLLSLPLYLDLRGFIGELMPRYAKLGSSAPGSPLGAVAKKGSSG